jgi:hypothetical protein
MTKNSYPYPYASQYPLSSSSSSKKFKIEYKENKVIEEKNSKKNLDFLTIRKNDVNIKRQSIDNFVKNKSKNFSRNKQKINDKDKDKDKEKGRFDTNFKNLGKLKINNFSFRTNIINLK